MNKLSILFYTSLVSLMLGNECNASSPDVTIQLHVAAVTQNAGATGSIEQPYSSLLQARNAIRRLRKQQSDNTRYHYDVVVHGGTYSVNNSIKFWKLDGGNDFTRITYRAKVGEIPRLFGGMVIPNTAIEPLPKGTFKQQLINSDAAKQIRMVKLKDLGVDDYGDIVRHGWGLNHIERLPPVALSMGDQRFWLSRWPNKDSQSPHMIKKHYVKQPRPLRGYEKKVQKIIDKVDLSGEVGLLKVIDSGDRARKVRNGKGGSFSVGFDRMKYWHQPEKIFLDGVLGSTWEWTYNQLASVDTKAKTISLKYPELNGIGLGNSVRLPHFHFDNIPEELDQAGEFYIDRSAGQLFFYPLPDSEDQPVVLVTLAEPMLAIENAANITFKGLTLSSGRNLGVDIINSNNITLDNVTVSNFVAGGVQIDGTDNTVANSHIVGSGAFGVYLDGGSKKTLKPANNVVTNSHIHDFGWDVKSQQPGIFINGVGNHVSHNKIHDGTHFAIRVRAANDSIIEKNEIFDLPKYHHFDGGALYVHSGRYPQARGVVIRDNYFHDIPTNGIYPDNFSWGVHIYKNIFYKVGVKANRSAVFVNGGGENHTYNNLVIDSNEIYRQGTRPKDEYWMPYWTKVQKRFGNGKIKRTAYSKYPDFAQWLTKKTEEEFYRPRSDVYNNVIINLSATINNEARKTGVVDKSKNLFSKNNYVLKDDPQFVDYENRNFNLQPSSPIFTLIEDFQAIDFSDMGIRD